MIKFQQHLKYILNNKFDSVHIYYPNFAIRKNS